MPHAVTSHLTSAPPYLIDFLKENPRLAIERDFTREQKQMMEKFVLLAVDAYYQNEQWVLAVYWEYTAQLTKKILHQLPHSITFDYADASYTLPVAHHAGKFISLPPAPADVTRKIYPPA